MLKNILRFVNIAPSTSSTQNHGLSYSDHVAAPDVLQFSTPGFTATATSTTVTVTNNTAVQASCDVYVECWHTYERVMATDPLVPQPFITSPGSGGVIGFTPGSVIFTGPTGGPAEDNASLFFNDTTNRLGINTNAPSVSLDARTADAVGADVTSVAQFVHDTTPLGAGYGVAVDLRMRDGAGTVQYGTRLSAVETTLTPGAITSTFSVTMARGGEFTEQVRMIPGTGGPAGTGATIEGYDRNLVLTANKTTDGAGHHVKIYGGTAGGGGFPFDGGDVIVKLGTPVLAGARGTFRLRNTGDTQNLFVMAQRDAAEASPDFAFTSANPRNADDVLFRIANFDRTLWNFIGDGTLQWVASPAGGSNTYDIQVATQAATLVGDNMSVTAGTGGAATAGAPGGAGGRCYIFGGTGGAGSGAQVAGAGSTLELRAGNAGANGGGGGNNGGNIDIFAGTRTGAGTGGNITLTSPVTGYTFINANATATPTSPVPNVTITAGSGFVNSPGPVNSIVLNAGTGGAIVLNADQAGGNIYHYLNNGDWGAFFSAAAPQGVFLVRGGVGPWLDVYLGRWETLLFDALTVRAVGGDFKVQTGVGGWTDNATQAGRGGNFDWDGGKGGVGSATGLSGVGGGWDIIAGDAGNTGGAGQGVGGGFSFRVGGGATNGQFIVRNDANNRNMLVVSDLSAASASADVAITSSVSRNADTSLLTISNAAVNIWDFRANYQLYWAASAAGGAVGVNLLRVKPQAATLVGDDLDITAGDGGAATAVAVGGAGGNMYMWGPIGGAGSGAQAAGRGGDLGLGAGNAGADGGGGGANGGDTIIWTAAGSGAGTAGIFTVKDNTDTFFRFVVYDNGATIITMPTAAAADAAFGANQGQFWMNEGTGHLMWKGKDSGGTVKTLDLGAWA